jgi:3-dehydroquinate synthase
VRRLIERAGLPVAGPTIAPQQLVELMAVDKKAAQGKVRFVVLEGIGRAALRSGLEDVQVREAIVAAAQ